MPGVVQLKLAGGVLGRQACGDYPQMVVGTPGRRLIFASATIEAQTRQALAALSPDVQLLAAGVAAVNEDIEHLYVVCEERDKPGLLRRLLHAFELPRSIVFVHRNDVAERFAAKLAHHKLSVADLNAELGKQERKEARDGIRSGAVRIMIASDLAARGLNIVGVTHVFNLDVPTMSKVYLHRAGRAGRAGSTGRGRKPRARRWQLHAGAQGLDAISLTPLK